MHGVALMSVNSKVSGVWPPPAAEPMSLDARRSAARHARPLVSSGATGSGDPKNMVPGVSTHATAPVTSTGTTDGAAADFVGLDASAAGGDATAGGGTDEGAVVADGTEPEPVAYRAWPGAAQLEIATAMPSVATVTLRRTARMQRETPPRRPRLHESASVPACASNDG